MTTFEALRQAGIPLDGLVREDAELHRYGVKPDRETPCWYVFHQLPNQTVAGAFGCWKKQIKQRFCSRDRTQMSATEWAEVCKAQQEAEAKRRLEEEKDQAEARERCVKIFSAPPLQSHPYLKTKGVRVHGRLVLSVEEITKDWLAMPLQDEKGVIHSAQFIADDGTKKFLWHGRIAGCWFPIGSSTDGPLVICEGYATGASIHEATEWTVCCAMNCGNMMAVAKAQRRLYPGRVLILAGDNDQFTEHNPGVTKATEAATAHKGLLCLPEFADEALSEKPTDFNDLHRLEGLSSVKRRLVEVAKLGDDWSLLVEDACDTMTEVIPDPIQIVEGLVCEQAKMVIGGSSKTYKTWFSMDIAMSISLGGSFLGRACKQCRVLYVNFELKPKTFKRRLQTIAKCKGMHFDYQQFAHLHLRGRTSGLRANQIVDKILDLALKKKVSVIVLDPLYKMNSGTKNENESGEQTAFLLEIDRLVTQAGATVIFDDHFSKGNQSEKDPLDAIRGSSVKGGDVDAATIIRAHKEKGSFIVSVVQRELPPIEDFVITWEYPIFRIDEALDAGDFKRPKGGRPSNMEPTAVLWAFEGTSPDSGLTVTALATKIGVSRQSLSQRYLPALRSKDWIATAGEGSSARQYITEKGSGVLRELAEKQ